MAQLVRHPTGDFCSGHDLKVMRLSPRSGSTLSGASSGDSVPCPSPILRLCTVSLQESINKATQKDVPVQPSHYSSFLRLVSLVTELEWSGCAKQEVLIMDFQSKDCLKHCILPHPVPSTVPIYPRGKGEVESRSNFPDGLEKSSSCWIVH